MAIWLDARAVPDGSGKAEHTRTRYSAGLRACASWEHNFQPVAPRRKRMSGDSAFNCAAVCSMTAVGDNLLVGLMPLMSQEAKRTVWASEGKTMKGTRAAISRKESWGKRFRSPTFTKEFEI